MGKGGCGRSASNLNAGQVMQAAQSSLRGGGAGLHLAASRGGAASSGAPSAGGASSSLRGGGAAASHRSGGGDAASDPTDAIDWIDRVKYEPRPNAQPGAMLPVMRVDGSTDENGRPAVVVQSMVTTLLYSPHLHRNCFSQILPCGAALTVAEVGLVPSLQQGPPNAWRSFQTIQRTQRGRWV